MSETDNGSWRHKTPSLAELPVGLFNTRRKLKAVGQEGTLVEGGTALSAHGQQRRRSQNQKKRASRLNGG